MVDGGSQGKAVPTVAERKNLKGTKHNCRAKVKSMNKICYEQL